MKATNKNKTKMVLIRLSHNDKKRLKEICKKQGMTYATWVTIHLNRWTDTWSNLGGNK